MSEATKNDADKLRYDLIPPFALERLAEVYTIGARKYADDNWRKGMSWRRVFAAMVRHSWAWFRGEQRDPEDGQLHLSSVAWCAFTLMEYEKFRLGTDDRPRPEPTVSEREIAKAVRRNAVPCFCLDATSRRCPVPGHSDKNSTPPAISSEQDAMAEALDLPLCGKEGCHVPLHQRDLHPTRFTD